MAVWNYFDISKLQELQKLTSDAQSLVFRLQNLQAQWDRLDDDLIDPLVETLIEARQELHELYLALKGEALEEEQDAAN